MNELMNCIIIVGIAFLFIYSLYNVFQDAMGMYKNPAIIHHETKK